MSLIKDTLDKVQEAARQGDEDPSPPPSPPSGGRETPQPADPPRSPRRPASPQTTGPGWGSRILWSVVVFTICLLLGAQLVYLAETFFSLSSLLP